MASVWAGANESTGKLVALKVIRPAFMATPGADAFLRSEGLVASRINHPNVVTVFDVVEQDGMACIVMELLDGLPFGTYIARYGPLGLRDAVSLLLPAMRGVAAAHAQGVVHRDLKPQNIFVCIGPDARIVTTKVLDFGISLMVDWARGSSVAAIPGVVGTPSYMSPEHIEGSTVLDPRTDVYGFGLLLYEALTGRMAFPGEPGPELLKRVLTESPTPLRELCPDLPTGVVVAIETAMAKGPEQRFEGLNEMVLVLEEQMGPAVPVPTGTPASGVPTTAMSYSVSSSIAIAVPSNIGREPSGPILKTQIFGQPMRPESEPDSPSLAAGDATPRRPLVPAVVDVGVPTELVSLRGRHLRARLRDRRVQLGAGMAALAVLLTAVVVLRAPRPSPGVAARPPAPMPAATRAAPANAPLAAPALPTAVVVPLQAQNEEPPVTEAAASPAVPPPEARPARARRAPRAGGAKAKPDAPSPRITKQSPLRAGSLSESDF